MQRATERLPWLGPGSDSVAHWRAGDGTGLPWNHGFLRFHHTFQVKLEGRTLQSASMKGGGGKQGKRFVGCPGNICKCALYDRGIISYILHAYRQSHLLALYTSPSV